MSEIKQNPIPSTGTFRKEIIGDELYLFNAKGELIFKRWLLTGQSAWFDVMKYDKYTLVSITDEGKKK
jgi:hypothetical protein